jgi:single-strand DNA-binding protein
MTTTVSGLVATTPRMVVTSDGLSILSFRFASASKRWDYRTMNWTQESDTNWFSVVAFNKLAQEGCATLAKGDRLIVTGQLKVRDWDNGERSGTDVELEATSIGRTLPSLPVVTPQVDPEVAPLATESHDCDCKSCNLVSA